MAAKARAIRYNGIKFRNRLAARWAVFFDTAGIEYLYETDPFDLGDGRPFLPDFSLRRGIRFLGEKNQRQNVWVAIKQVAGLDGEEREKITEFVEKSGEYILLIIGDPGPEADILFIGRNEEMELDAGDVSFMELAGNQVGLVDEREKARLKRDEDRELVERRKQTDLLQEAYRAAGEARFDRGMKHCRECGREFQPKSWHNTICYPCHNRLGSAAGNGKTSSRPKNNDLDVESLLQVVPPEQRRLLLSAISVVFIGLCALIVCQITAFPGTVSSWLEPESRPTATPALPATYTPVPTPEVVMEGLVPGIVVTRSICPCTADLFECSDFSSQEEAQSCFELCLPANGDVHLLDVDGDGLACQTAPVIAE